MSLSSILRVINSSNGIHNGKIMFNLLNISSMEVYNNVITLNMKYENKVVRTIIFDTEKDAYNEFNNMKKSLDKYYNKKIEK